MSDYLARTRTAASPVDPRGVYIGTVTRVNEALQQVWVEVGRLTPGFQYGPLSVAGSALPAPGDRVAVQFLENQMSEMLVLGFVRTPVAVDYVPPVACTSTTRPAGPRVGTIIFEADTTRAYVWTGAAWLSLTGEEVLVDDGEVTDAYTVDLSLGSFHRCTVIGDTTLTMGNPPPAGQVGRFTLEVTMGDSGWTITWPESFQWALGIGPLSPPANEVLTVSGYTLTGGETWYIRIPDYLAAV